MEVFQLYGKYTYSLTLHNTFFLFFFSFPCNSLFEVPFGKCELIRKDWLIIKLDF